MFSRGYGRNAVQVIAFCRHTVFFKIYQSGSNTFSVIFIFLGGRWNGRLFAVNGLFCDFPFNCFWVGTAAFPCAGTGMFKLEDYFVFVRFILPWRILNGYYISVVFTYVREVPISGIFKRNVFYIRHGNFKFGSNCPFTDNIVGASVFASVIPSRRFLILKWKYYIICFCFYSAYNAFPVSFHSIRIESAYGNRMW